MLIPMEQRMQRGAVVGLGSLVFVSQSAGWGLQF